MPVPKVVVVMAPNSHNLSFFFRFLTDPVQKQDSMRRNAGDSPKVARDKIEHPQMSPLHEMKTANDPAPPAKDNFDGGGLFPGGMDKGSMDFNWSGEVSEEKLQIARDMYAQLPDAYKQGDAGDRQVVSGFMALVMGVVAMFRVGKIAPKRAMDAAMGIATMEAMAKKTRQMQMQQQMQLGGPDAVVVSAAQYQALVKRLDDLEGKVAALAAKPPEVPPELEESLKAAAARVEALETELDATKKLLETSNGQQEEVLAYIEKKKKKRGMVSDALALLATVALCPMCVFLMLVGVGGHRHALPSPRTLPIV